MSRRDGKLRPLRVNGPDCRTSPGRHIDPTVGIPRFASLSSHLVTAGQFHNSSGVVEYIAGVNNIVLPLTLCPESIFKEIDAVIKLVVGKLREIRFRHDW